MKLNVYWCSDKKEFWDDIQTFYCALITTLKKEEIKAHLKSHLESNKTGYDIGLNFFVYDVMNRYGLVVEDIDCDFNPSFEGKFKGDVINLMDLVREINDENRSTPR